MTLSPMGFELGTAQPPSTQPGYLFPVDTTINSIIATASAAQGASNSAVLNLSNVAGSIIAPTISVPTIDTGIAPALETNAAPAVTMPVWVAPGLPATFTEVLTVDDLGVAPFDANPPAIMYGTAPAAFTEALPTSPAINLTYTDPTLSVNLPAAPDLLSISIAPFNGLNLPTFSDTAPVLDLVAPSIREYVPGQQYTSSLLTAIKASLQDRIVNGGSGLSPAVENAIWDRGREREARSARDALADLDRMERLGYAFPPGVYTDARLRITTETDYANRGHSREVMIKAAELELDNVKHALDGAVQLESRLIDYSNQIEQRIFESTRYATEAGIAIYNGKVQAFAALVDVYRAKVQVYQAQIQAEVSRVEAYKAQVEAEQAKAQVNVAKVDAYKAQIEAALSAVEIYKAQIAGIQAKADIERTKVMVFGEQVRGYVAQVNAYTAGVEGYRASLEGEKTKVQVYQAQVEAFRTKVEASSRQVEARVSAYRGRIDASNARWDAYKAQASAEASRIQSIAATNGAVADIYKSVVTGTASFNDVLTKQWQAQIEAARGAAEVAVSAAKANGELYISSRSIIADCAKVSAQVSGQLAAAAINTYSHSFSQSVGSSVSSSYSQSRSDSASQSVSYNYSGTL